MNFVLPKRPFFALQKPNGLRGVAHFVNFNLCFLMYVANKLILLLLKWHCTAPLPKTQGPSTKQRDHHPAGGQTPLPDGSGTPL